MDDLKERLLKLLDEDEEFRHKLVSCLGISGLPEKVEKLEKAQDKLWDGLRMLREGHRKLWEMQRRSSKK